MSAHAMFCARCGEATATIVHTGGRDLCPECAGPPGEVWRAMGATGMRAVAIGDGVPIVWAWWPSHGRWQPTDMNEAAAVISVWAMAERAARLALEKKLADAEGEIARARKACHLMDRDGPLDEALPRAIGWEPTPHGLAHPIDGRPSEWNTAYAREMAAHNETRRRLADAERDLAELRADARERRNIL